MISLFITIQTLDSQEGDRIIRKVYVRILPFIFILYMINYIDRVNLGFAALTMNPDLGITPVAFGIVSGVFFIGYIIFEYPSNRLMERLGARIWLPRILISWGLVVVLLSCVTSAFDVGILRFLLGLAEAGFYPGIVLYLSYWLRHQDMARALSYVLAAPMIALIIGAPVSTLILDHVNWFGIASWRWLFVAEGLPAIILGIVTSLYLDNSPRDAGWLSSGEKEWLAETIKKEKESDGKPEQKPLMFFFRQVWFHRLWIVYSLAMCSLYAIVFWLPQQVQSFHITSSLLQIGLISAVPYVVAFFCMLIWAHHSDATKERRYHLIIPFACSALGFLGDALASNPIHALAFMSIAIAGLYSAFPVLWALVAERMSRVDASGGVALVSSLGCIGGFIGPFLMGVFVQSSGGVDAVPAFITLASFMVIAILLVQYDFQVKAGTRY